MIAQPVTVDNGIAIGVNVTLMAKTKPAFPGELQELKDVLYVHPDEWDAWAAEVQRLLSERTEAEKYEVRVTSRDSVQYMDLAGIKDIVCYELPTEPGIV